MCGNNRVHPVWAARSAVLGLDSHSTNNHFGHLQRGTSRASYRPYRQPLQAGLIGLAVSTINEAIAGANKAVMATSEAVVDTVGNAKPAHHTQANERDITYETTPRYNPRNRDDTSHLDVPSLVQNLSEKPRPVNDPIDERPPAYTETPTPKTKPQTPITTATPTTTATLPNPLLTSPLLQHHLTSPLIIADLNRLTAALTVYQNSDSRSRSHHPIKHAARQLLRDLKMVEEERCGGRRQMTREQRRMLKAEARGMKSAFRDVVVQFAVEQRRARHGGCK